MKNIKGLIETAINQTKPACNKRVNSDLRAAFFSLSLLDMGLKHTFCEDEKPAKGAAWSIIEMKTVYRVQVRCGYGKHNYAPCIEIPKNQ